MRFSCRDICGTTTSTMWYIRIVHAAEIATVENSKANLRERRGYTYIEVITEFRTGNSGQRQTRHQEYPKTHKGCLGERKHTMSLHYGCNGVDRYPSCTPAHPLRSLPLSYTSQSRAHLLSLSLSLSTHFPSPCAPGEMVGWACSGLHPRSHLFIIKFHVYRQPVR